MHKARYTTKEYFVTYIRNKMSARIAERVGSIVRRYIAYVIDAILHGYVIRMGNIVKFSFAKIPVGEYSESQRTYYFQSNLTSDWLFFIDIECEIMKKNHVAFVPSKQIKKKVQDFIDSEKVYELIR